MMIIPPYHKGRETSLLYKIPVLFNFVTFALSSSQWLASRTEGRIIRFRVWVLACGNVGSRVKSDTGFSSEIPVPKGHLSHILHLAFQPACQACVLKRRFSRAPRLFKQDYILESRMSLFNFNLVYGELQIQHRS